MRLQRIYPSFAAWLTATAAVLFLLPMAKAQCLSPYTAELHGPVGMVQANSGDLLVGESGLVNEVGCTGAEHRHYLYREPRRTPNAAERFTVRNQRPRRRLRTGGPLPDGADALCRDQRRRCGGGRSIPGSIVANPTPSSPLFSSVLAFHFSSSVERSTAGFSMTLATSRRWLAAVKSLCPTWVVTG